MCVFILANTCVLIATCVADVQPACIVAGKSWDLNQKYTWKGLITLLNLRECSFKIVGVIFCRQMWKTPERAPTPLIGKCMYRVFQPWVLYYKTIRVIHITDLLF